MVRNHGSPGVPPPHHTNPHVTPNWPNVDPDSPSIHPGTWEMSRGSGRFCSRVGPLGWDPFSTYVSFGGRGVESKLVFSVNIVVYIIFKAIGGLSASRRTWTSASDGTPHSLADRNRIMFLPKTLLSPKGIGAQM